MDISLIGNAALRIAIQRNLVSFPSQSPAFLKRSGGDAQGRIAQLYFALGWTVRSICERYGLSKAMVQKLLSEWRIRALAAGYIQDIHPEGLEALVHMKDELDWPIHSGVGTGPGATVRFLPTAHSDMSSQASV